MFGTYDLFLIVFGYFLLLFVLAYYAEHREKAGKSVVNNPYIYSLSLAVYCTSWTFYGSVGKAATSGLSFLTIYLGPTLMAALWMVVLGKVVRIAKANRITTISDFIGSRYGKSLFLSSLVSVVAVVGVTPYIGLQIKAIINTFSIITGETASGPGIGFFITLALGIFAIIFGARRLDSSERHGGLVFAIAFESIIKLVAFLAVGVFVTFHLFGGFPDLFSKVRDSEFSALLFLGVGTATNYPEWFSLIFLSMMAIMFLPRQFQMAVVENYDESHISKAAWLFPLYLFLINIFVLPIAFGGLLLGGAQSGADFFVLTVPLNHGARYLALLAFLGGFSAATGMVIVEAIALSTMVMNSVIMPALINFHDAPKFPEVVLTIKRFVILGIVYFGYLFAISVGEFYSLVDIGLKSFEAVALFAPAFFLGLYWKRGTRRGAVAGLLAGFGVWFYTLILPALIKAGLIADVGLIHSLVHSEFLSPEKLFGIEGLGMWGNPLFWGMLANLLFYVGVSVFTRPSKEEELQSFIFVDTYERLKDLAHGSSYSVKDIEEVIALYLGPEEAAEAIRGMLAKMGKETGELTSRELIEVRNEAERILSGSIGSSMAAIIFEDKLVLTEKERGELSESIKHIAANLRLSRQELAEANRELSYLKEFSENIIESAPIGIVTVDSRLRVKYWNREMEGISGFGKGETFNRLVTDLLPWVPWVGLGQGEQWDREIRNGVRAFKVNVSPFKDPSGGYVVIIEDVTEKKKMEEQLLQASKLASVGKLTAGISHEIGNPLASISSLVQELRSLDLGRAEDVDFTFDSLRTVNNHLERIARIVRSLGDFARLSTAEKAPCSLQEIFDRTVNLIKYDKRFKTITFAADIRPLPLLQLNADQIQQVFLNLLLNALDAVPEHGRLSVSMGAVNGAAEVVFSDNGSGIDDASLDRIFDPFFTTKPYGKGTGLGLSICYGIVKDHGGTITVQSTKGEGSVFTIRLPLDG